MDTRGIRLSLTVAGPTSGDLVVLIHDSGGSSQDWVPGQTALAAAGFYTVAMDLRGHGASDRPPSGYDIPTAASDIQGVIRAFGDPATVIALAREHTFPDLTPHGRPRFSDLLVRYVAAKFPLDVSRHGVVTQQPKPLRWPRVSVLRAGLPDPLSPVDGAASYLRWMRRSAAGRALVRSLPPAPTLLIDDLVRRT